MEKLKPEYTFTDELKTKVESILSQLKQETPEAFEDGQINFDILKDLIGAESIDDEAPEHFGLNWPGKRQARRLASLPPKGTLKPCIGEGINEETTENIFIEGENLEVLKILRKSYRGKIKMIYIDPPYNTGNDFIYKDDFSEPLEDYLRKSGQKTEEGLLTTNPKSQGRFHSNWFNFIYPRLRIAKDLLRDDGVVFVSLDDNEINNLRAIMNEVFGEENFISQMIIVSNKRGQTYKDIAKTHEYLLCYSNSEISSVNELEKEESDLTFNDNKGDFSIRELRNRNPKFGRFNRPNLFYPVYISKSISDENNFHAVSLTKDDDYCLETFPLNSSNDESCWRWGKKLFEEQNSSDLSFSNLVARQKQNGGWNIYEKYRKSTFKVKSIWDDTKVISEQGTLDLKNVGLAGYFDFPKPVELIKRAIQLGSNKDDIILDFFSGSCSTAQAVLELNLSDNSNRKFICVQLDEPSNENSIAFKNGYFFISDVSKLRIKKAIENIKKEYSGDYTFEHKFGFKTYKLNRSNIREWQDVQPTVDARGMNLFSQLEQQNQQPIHENTKPEDLITEFMLVEGFPLHAKISKLDNVNSNTVFKIIDSEIPYSLFVCLDDLINPLSVDKLQITKKDTFICLDRSFNGNDQVKMQLDDICKLKTV